MSFASKMAASLPSMAMCGDASVVKRITLRASGLQPMCFYRENVSLVLSKLSTAANYACQYFRTECVYMRRSLY